MSSIRAIIRVSSSVYFVTNYFHIICGKFRLNDQRLLPNVFLEEPTKNSNIENMKMSGMVRLNDTKRF